MLGDGCVVNARSEKDGDFFLRSVVDVDFIEADAVLGNDLEAG